MTLYLHGVGHDHPDTEITNRFLEDLDIGTSDTWILDRVGIRSRRTVLPLDYIRETQNAEPRAVIEAATIPNATLGARAARLALERAGLSASDVGMVIAGGCVPDTVTPAEAAHVAQELGIEVPAFDVNSACTSFLVGVNLLSWMRPEALPPFVLVVAAESMTKTVDYRDRTAAVLWGDAGAAAVLSTREPSAVRLLGHAVESSPAGHDKVEVPRLGHFTQEGRTVQMFAIRKSVELLRRLQEEYAAEDRPLHFVGHQANLRMLENVCRKCDISPEHHHSNVEWYGNTAAASGLSVLSQNWDKWRDRDDVALVGVGAGLTWSSLLVRFGEDDGR
ncbi:MAG: ketoacyl-ACP synthase III [Proteobacteria bacterium]|nr:ketoacyl-ACP synthase III [Pseudomonadota bacterium]